MKFSFNLFGKAYMFSFHRIDRPRTVTGGITSRIAGTNMHVLFMDYDIIREDYLLHELEFLQEVFKLGNIYVFRSRVAESTDSRIVDGEMLEGGVIGGYHAICLDVNTLRYNIMVLRSSSSDYAFISAPFYNPEKHWVLRTAPKGERDPPVYVRVLESEFEGVNDKMQSTWHARFLDEMYDLGIEETLVNPDGNEEGIMDYYVTAKRVK